MTETILCYRCGESLAALTLPLSRRDLCPGCGVHVHVCRMCDHFDPDVPGQCREEDAEDVLEKERVNFCDWFVPSGDAFDPRRSDQAHRAEAELRALFGDGDADGAGADGSLADAEDLFK